jgi:hypothetical protein
VSELALYLLGFWRFVFSEEYRKDTIYDFKKGGFATRFFAVIEAGISIIIGLLFPLYIVFLFFSMTAN